MSLQLLEARNLECIASLSVPHGDILLSLLLRCLVCRARRWRLWSTQLSRPRRRTPGAVDEQLIRVSLHLVERNDEPKVVEQQKLKLQLVQLVNGQSTDLRE